MNFDVFYSPDFLEIIKRVYKLKDGRQHEQASLLGKFPLLTSRLPFKSTLAFNLPFGFYQTSRCIQQLVTKDDWVGICEYSRLINVNISFSSVGELPFGLGIHFANNPILNLTESRDPFDRYSKNHRQNIRKERNKSANYEVTVSFTESKDDLFQFYDVMANQYVRDHKMIFQPFDLFSELLLSGIGKLLVAKHGDEVLGGLFCIFDGEVFHYNWGARKQFKNLNVGTLLIDYAVTYAHQAGYKYFDFGSTPLSDDYLFQFKMKWGCENHRVYKYFTKKVLPQTDLNNSFIRARNVYSKFPPKIAQRMMSFVVPWFVS